MNIVIIIEFMIIAIFHIINVHSILRLISHDDHYSKINLISFLVYLLLALLFITTELYYTDNKIRIPIFIFYFIFMIVCSCSSNRKFRFKNTAYATVFYITIDAILQSAIYLFSQQFFAQYYKRLIMRSISLFINIVIFAIIYYKLSSKTKNVQIMDFNIIPQNTYVLILISLICFECMLENQLIYFDASDIMLYSKITKILAIICITMLILIIITLLFICLRKSYYESLSSLLEDQINMQVEYYNRLEGKNTELRNFRHDYKNHMLCLQSLILDRNFEEANEYIQSITNRSYADTIEYATGNKIADAILSDKAVSAKNINTVIDFDGEIYDEIALADVCVILSNALDNAIESCEKIAGSNKVIKVRCIFSKGVQIINIANPVDVAADIWNGSIETTKQDKSNHGLGIYNIKRTVDKYNGNFSIRCEDGLFILEVGLNVLGYMQENACCSS